MRPSMSALGLGCLLVASCGWAHYPPGVEYDVYQFPPGQAPTIDADDADWQAVPDRCRIDGTQLEDTVMGKGGDMDPADLAVEVTVGWSAETNRLYFLYKVDDDMHNFDPEWGDIFEVVLDADHSGGRYHSFPDVDPATEENLKSTTCQNYHIFTPPGPGRPWAWVWGTQQWLVDKPWAEAAYKYSFQHKQPGALVLEFYITPFNYASHLGPDYSATHRLVEGHVIGLSWSVLDYDEDHKRYEGFWNLSHHTRMDMTADLLPNFRLLPLGSD